VLVMTDMLGQLLVQRGLQHRLGQLLEQPILAGQRQALLPGPLVGGLRWSRPAAGMRLGGAALSLMMDVVGESLPLAVLDLSGSSTVRVPARLWRVLWASPRPLRRRATAVTGSLSITT
jgi:hypothetical protein